MIAIQYEFSARSRIPHRPNGLFRVYCQGLLRHIDATRSDVVRVGADCGPDVAPVSHRAAKAGPLTWSAGDLVGQARICVSPGLGAGGFFRFTLPPDGDAPVREMERIASPAIARGLNETPHFLAGLFGQAHLG